MVIGPSRHVCLLFTSYKQLRWRNRCSSGWTNCFYLSTHGQSTAGFQAPPHLPLLCSAQLSVGRKLSLFLSATSLMWRTVVRQLFTSSEAVPRQHSHTLRPLFQHGSLTHRVEMVNGKERPASRARSGSVFFFSPSLSLSHSLTLSGQLL